MSDMTLAASWATGAEALRRDAQKLLQQAGEADRAVIEAAGWSKSGSGWYHGSLPSSDEGLTFDAAHKATLDALRLFGKLARGDA